MLEWKDAEALINEARNLRYKGTMYERSLLERLSIMQPAVLTEADEKSLILLYRRAAGAYSRR
jgi:hypothetical protein